MQKISSSTNPASGKIFALLLTAVILILGTFFYFAASDKSSEMIVTNSTDMETNVSQKQMNPIESYSNMNSTSKYSLIGIQENNVYIKATPEGMQKLFYYHPVNEPINIPLSEGNVEEYQIHSIAGQKYYPLILGYEESKVMKQEGLFYNIGDPIKNFFGKNVVIVGIMQKTGGAMDMVHLIPLTWRELD